MPIRALLVRQMKAAVDSLRQLNLRRFRIPQKTATRYSALDVMKQALELLCEFSPSEMNYREAIRTIQVYSEGDMEMLHTLRGSFFLIANAVYNAFSGQPRAESVAPEILFLQGIPFDPIELQQSFRFVGVRSPEISPPSVKKTAFLNEAFEPYKHLSEGKVTNKQAQARREEHWANVIEATLSSDNETALFRGGAEHLDRPRSPIKQILSTTQPSDMGRLPSLLRRKGIVMRIIDRIADVNEVFGKT